METSGINSVNTNTSNTKPEGLLSNKSLGKDEFLQLLVAQLKNQDPFNPMEGTDFAAQLAQFSSVEQLTSIDSNLKDGLSTDMMLTQAVNNTMAANFIGKEVTSLGNTVTLVSGDHPSLNFLVSDYADKATVKIADETGKVVRTIKMSGLSSGRQSAEWDGLDDNGNPLPGGNYTFSVEAENGKGETVNVQELTKGIVSTIRYVDGHATLLVNGKEISLADVLEIG